MFNPKITPGRWEIWPEFSGDNVCTDLGPIAVGGTGSVFAERADDLKATSAVPELLEIYKAGVRLLGAKSEDEEVEGITGLADAVNTLEERHCERN